MKLILADDDPMILRALSTILGVAGFEVVATAERGEAAISAWHQYQPDLLLLDIRMPGLSGLEVAKQILDEDPEAKILLLTTFKDEEWLSEALALGCRGYLLKQNFGSIVPAIQAVAAGNHVFDQEVVASLRESPAAYQDPNLNERENEILLLLAQGLNNKEIADELYLSEGTVRNYISHMLEKLELRDRTQLAVMYYQKILERRPF